MSFPQQNLSLQNNYEKKKKITGSALLLGVKCIFVINVSNPLKTTPVETSHLG